MHTLEGNTKAIEYLVNGALDNLVKNDVWSPFYKVMLDIKRIEGDINSISQRDFNNLKNKELTDEQWKLFIFALQVFLSSIQTHTLTVVEAETDPIRKQALKTFYAKRAADVGEVSQFLQNERKDSTDKSILEHFDFCIKEG